ncbi:hypothetical protein CRH09_26690 [Nocardia terpenica]|uniref:Uncharacterized protein n=1 Tax=Nocardia terpenica TaxID=455432 RepID=A0A291RNQ2_9NOCA|nr:hypothetical protein CRH09_26690 [Nocardia terpenica]
MVIGNRYFWVREYRDVAPSSELRLSTMVASGTRPQWLHSRPKSGDGFGVGEQEAGAAAHGEQVVEGGRAGVSGDSLVTVSIVE